MGEVSLTEVGTAEDVLQRLVNERRALENAQQVLRTYRMVKSEMEPALAELDSVRKQIVEERKELQAVEQQRFVALQRVEEEVEGYREKLVTEAEGKIEEKRDMLRVMIAEYEDHSAAIEKQRERYVEESEGYEREIVRLKGELESIRVEHSTLAEAIGRAAGFFSSTSASTSTRSE